MEINLDKSPEVSGFKNVDGDAAENAKIFKQLRAYRNEWIKDRVENDDFFHGQQYSVSESSDIESRGQAPLAINITYSVVKQIISLITSVDPTWKVTPVGDSNKEMTYLYREMLNATWYNSRGSRQLSQIVKDTCIAGVGYGISLPSYGDDGFSINFSHVPYYHAYVSPGTSRFDYNDADDFVISKMMGIKQIAEIFDVSEEEVEKFGFTEFDALGEDFYPKYAKPMSMIMTVGESEEEVEPMRQMRVIQRYSIEKKDVYIVEGVKTDKTQPFSLPRRIYFELTDDIRALESRGMIKVTKVNRKVVCKRISAGQRCQKSYLPIDRYNIVPYIDEFRSNPYPLGVIDFVYPLQRALNKFILLAILNATLANNMQMIAEEGTVDEHYWQENYSVPGALMLWKRVDDKSEAPVQKNPSALPASFFEFPQMLIQMIEYITGMFGIMQGNPDGAPRTLGGVNTMQNMGGQKVKLLTRNIADALAYQGDVTLQLYQNYSPYNQQINYTMNGEEVSQSYNQTRIEGGQLFIDKDISQGRYKTRVTIEPNYGGERQSKANMLANLAMQTKSPSLLAPILKLADVPEADEIIKSLDQLQQAQATAEQVQKEVERLTQINQQLQNEVIQKSQKVELAQFTAQLDMYRTKLEKELGIKFEREMSQLREEIAKFKPEEKKSEKIEKSA